MQTKNIFIFSLLFLFSFNSYSQTGLLTINTSNNITLPGGNYIVKDPLYDEGALTDIGIVSLYDGTTNALISTLKGANSGDKAGKAGIAVLSDGNFIVLSNKFLFRGSNAILTFIKNNLAQNLVISNNNSFVNFYFGGCWQGSKATDFISIYELPNKNILIHFFFGCFQFEGEDSVILVKTNTLANNFNDSNSIYLNTYIQENRPETYLRLLKIFPNNDILIFWEDWGSRFVSLFDGNSGNLKWKFTSENNGLQYPIPPNYVNRCIDQVDILDVSLVKMKYLTCFAGYPHIKLNALDFQSPIIDVYANTSSTQSGAEPFLTVSPTGSNPIEENQYTAKVWLNEPTAFVNDGKTYLPRHFEISPISTLPDITARVKLYFTQAEFDSYNSLITNQLKLPTRSDDAAGKHHLQIIKYSGVSNTNYGLPNSYAGDQLVINPIDTDIIWNGSMWEVSFNTKGFSGFFVSTEFEMPLPLSLESFTVKHLEKGNELNWQTSNETGSQYFDIERSLNGAKFDKIGQLSAQNNKETNYYHFIDPSDNFNNPSEIIYYRLKIQDFDGKYAYSKIISIQNNVNNRIFINPNPVANKMNLYIGEANLLNSDCQIINILGQKMHEFKLIKTNYELDVSSLPIGIYYLLLKDGKKIKFIKN